MQTLTMGKMFSKNLLQVGMGLYKYRNKVRMKHKKTTYYRKTMVNID